MKDQKKSHDMVRGFLIFFLVIGIFSSVFNPFLGLCYASISLTIAAANDKNDETGIFRLGKRCAAVIISVSVVFFILKNILHLYGG